MDLLQSVEGLSYSHTRDREAAMRKGTNMKSNVPKDVLLKNSVLMLPLLSLLCCFSTARSYRWYNREN